MRDNIRWLTAHRIPLTERLTRDRETNLNNPITAYPLEAEDFECAYQVRDDRPRLARRRPSYRNRKRVDPNPGEEGIPLTVPELRRLIYAVLLAPKPNSERMLAWSRLRRRKQH